MAFYTLTNLAKAQLKLRGEFAANDTRYRKPEVFLFLIANTTNFFPNINEIRTSEKRESEASYFVRTPQALITTGRAHDHTGTSGDTGVMSLSWTTYTTTFATTLKQADSNTYTLQEQFNNNVRQKIIDFADGFDSLSSTFLFNNRSGVNVATVKGTFNATDDVYRITQATYGKQGIHISKLVMDVNAYNGVNYVVCDSLSYSDFQEQAAQGAQNATNQSFQFLNVTFIHDASLGAKAVALNALYVKGFWMVVPKDHVAVVDWITKQNRAGKETSVNMYGSLRNPVDKLLYGVHSYETRANGTSRNGEKQDVVTEVEIGIDLAFAVAPSSTANSTPIMAFAFV